MLALVAVAALSGKAAAAPPEDWSQIPTKTIKLFYPGESSYQWLRSPAHKFGNLPVSNGQSCTACHQGGEDKLGNNIVSGGPIEPNPIKGKSGVIDLAVQAAYDDKNIYWRFQWKTDADRPGQMHNYIRYNGEEWEFYGGPRSSDRVRSGQTPPLYEDRLLMIIDDGNVPLYKEQGCWLTCHQGQRDMPGRPSSEQVREHPLLGKELKRSDVRKYLPSTRNDENASWDRTRSAEEIAKMKSEGSFLELMQWRGARSNAIGMSDDGYVLEYRLFDEGKGPFSWNVDRSTMTPKYMFDKAKVGVNAITVSEVGDPSKPYAVIREENAIAYDPNLEWKKDDVLPGRLLSREDANGSAADNNYSEGTWKDGMWTLTWTRPLDTGHPEDDKILRDGHSYTISFAVHDDSVTTRFHHVSFPFSLGLGKKADIEPVKLTAASAVSAAARDDGDAVSAAAPTDDDPRIEAWGARWPEYVEMYLETKDMSKPTPFGGNTPYSKLMRFPGKTVLWAGYAFAVDFNEERGHYYSQIDQLETKRNDREYLNAHGLPNFKGQPGSCMNCHSGWAAKLASDMGWETFNRTPYWNIVESLREAHGEGTSGAELGSACADCHGPDMRLRVNRQGFIDAMVRRGYETDSITGLKGSASEMRDFVCMQCHVEYYFKGPNAILTFPWDYWPKDEPLKVEMIESYYEAERARPGGFRADWTHAITKALLVKMQHPEAEVVSSGKHAGMIGCVDCHMPKIQRDGKTVTDHVINSPLNKLDSCQICHANESEDQLYQRVYDLQVRNVAELLRAEKAILALIMDVATVRSELANREPFKDMEDDSARESAISEALAEVLDHHRRASLRWDFIGASNSTGAHSPTEALRVLGQAVELAEQGQQTLKGVADDYAIDLVLTVEPEHPPAPAPIEPGNIVGSEPPEITRKADKDVQAFPLLVASRTPIRAQKTKREAVFTEGGSQSCLVCHSGERMRSVQAGVHGESNPLAKHGCEDCHGPGSFHVSRAHGGRGFPAMIAFGKGSGASPRDDQVSMCLGCHADEQSDEHAIVFRGSHHDKSFINCSTCHSVHENMDRIADKDAQAATCHGCHIRAEADHPRFDDQGIDFDALKCSNCHDSHRLVSGG